MVPSWTHKSTQRPRFYNSDWKHGVAACSQLLLASWSMHPGYAPLQPGPGAPHPHWSRVCIQGIGNIARSFPYCPGAPGQPRMEQIVGCRPWAQPSGVSGSAVTHGRAESRDVTPHRASSESTGTRHPWRGGCSCCATGQVREAGTAPTSQPWSRKHGPSSTPQAWPLWSMYKCCTAPGPAQPWSPSLPDCAAPPSEGSPV